MDSIVCHLVLVLLKMEKLEGSDFVSWVNSSSILQRRSPFYAATLDAGAFSRVRIDIFDYRYLMFVIDSVSRCSARTEADVVVLNW